MKNQALSLREEIEIAFKSSKGSWMQARIKDPKNSALVEKIKAVFPDVSSLDEAIWLCWAETQPPRCLRCGGPIRFKTLKDGYTSVHCSLSCGGKTGYTKGKKTKLLRGSDYDFGSENFYKLMIDRYGVKYTTQSLKLKAKIQDTLQEKYGVTSPFHLVKDRVTSQQSEAAREKKRQTNIERYGSPSPFGSLEVQAKSQRTLVENHGVKNPMHSSEILKKVLTNKLSNWKLRRIDALKTTVTLISPIEELTSKNSQLKWECVTCKKLFVSNLDDGKTPKCRACNPSKKIGHRMAEKFSLLIGGALGPEKQNDRTIIYPDELDFYWPEKNLAVEFSGLYWHGELVCGEKKTEFRKLKKVERTCPNLRLLTFYEDELRDKPGIVRSIVLTAGGAFERQEQTQRLKIAELTVTEARGFTENNHLQGYAGGFLRLGLKTIEDDELLAIMIVGKSRFAKSSKYELIRFCRLLNTQVIGAFGKLLDAVKKRLKAGTIISYIDNRVFTGRSYLHHNFTLSHVNEPVFYWTDRTHRYYRQHKLMNKPMTSDKVWNCGQSVYELTF